MNLSKHFLIQVDFYKPLFMKSWLYKIIFDIKYGSFFIGPLDITGSSIQSIPVLQ